MEAVKAAIVTGEGKAVTSVRLHGKQKLAACFEALNLLLEKTAAGELRDGTPGGFRCGVQRRACRWWTMLGIGKRKCV
jgi:hypothetical protein